MTNQTGSAEAIHDLIQTCIDGQKGFEAAAKVVEDPTIKDELVGYSWQRQQFASDLRSHLPSFTEAPRDPRQHERRAASRVDECEVGVGR